LEYFGTSTDKPRTHYFRQSKATDSKQQVQDFLVIAYAPNQKANKKPYMIKIGNRLSSNYYRVSQKAKIINYDVYSEVNHGLEFELELKNKLVKSFQQFLFDNQIEEFEDRLTQHFFKQSIQNFGLNFCYTDWLAKFLRKVVQKTRFSYRLFRKYPFKVFWSNVSILSIFNISTKVQRGQTIHIISSPFPSLIFYSLQVFQVSQEKGTTN